MSNPGIQTLHSKKVIGGEIFNDTEQLAVEEPLEIRLQYGSGDEVLQKTVSITMRTPGNDRELAAGFLFTEGILQRLSQIKMIIPDADGPNTVLVVLHEGIQPSLSTFQRNFYITSGCGICGKASVEAIRTVSVFETNHEEIFIDCETIYSLPDKVREMQTIFESTGGLHASALFSEKGNFLSVKEDVGRHNALDKLIGESFLANKLPLSRCILFLSGRASFELVQKAYMAGIQLIAAVGAPSSLAVELAESNKMALIGFLRGKKFNIYSGSDRIH